MNCDTVQSLLLDARHGAELEAHLASCASCRAFARALRVFKKSIAPPPLPQTVHDKILLQSATLLRAHAARASRTPRLRSSSVGRLVFAAALLVYCVGLGLIAALFTRENLDQIFVAAFLLQNLIAACLAPLLFTRAHIVRHLEHEPLILGAIRT